MTLDTRPESAKIRSARKISGIAICNSAEHVYNFNRQPNTHFLHGDPQSGPTDFPGRKPAEPLSGSSRLTTPYRYTTHAHPTPAQHDAQGQFNAPMYRSKQ